MTAPRDHKVYCEDILRAIAHIEQYTNGMTLEQFKEDTKTQDAVVRNLEIIGEAVKCIPEDIRNANPRMMWGPAAAMRDFLIHEYPEVDVGAVWNTVVSDLPPFKKGVEGISERLKW